MQAPGSDGHRSQACRYLSGCVSADCIYRRAPAAAGVASQTVEVHDPVSLASEILHNSGRWSDPIPDPVASSTTRISSDTRQ